MSFSCVILWSHSLVVCALKMSCLQICLSKITYTLIIKRALDNFSLIPRFFKKKVEIGLFIPLEVYVSMQYFMLDCTCNFNLITKILCELFLHRPFLKVYLLKMAATAMTVEFGTIHHYSSLQENSEACFCSSLNRFKN